MSWLHRFTTIFGKLSACANSGYQPLFLPANLKPGYEAKYRYSCFSFPSCTFRMASHVYPFFISLYIIASDIPHLLLQLLWLNSACCSDHTQHIALLFTNIRKMVYTVATITPCKSLSIFPSVVQCSFKR